MKSKVLSVDQDVKADEPYFWQYSVHQCFWRDSDYYYETVNKIEIDLIPSQYRSVLTISIP